MAEATSGREKSYLLEQAVDFDHWSKVSELEPAPEIARAVAKAEADARAPVQGAIPAAPVDPLPPMQYPPLSQQQQGRPPQAPQSGRHSGSTEL